MGNTATSDNGSAVDDETLRLLGFDPQHTEQRIDSWLRRKGHYQWRVEDGVRIGELVRPPDPVTADDRKACAAFDVLGKLPDFTRGGMWWRELRDDHAWNTARKKLRRSLKILEPTLQQYAAAAASRVSFLTRLLSRVSGHRDWYERQPNEVEALRVFAIELQAAGNEATEAHRRWLALARELAVATRQTVAATATGNDLLPKLGAPGAPAMRVRELLERMLRDGGFGPAEIAELVWDRKRHEDERKRPAEKRRDIIRRHRDRIENRYSTACKRPPPPPDPNAWILEHILAEAALDTDRGAYGEKT